MTLNGIVSYVHPSYRAHHTGGPAGKKKKKKTIMKHVIVTCMATEPLDLCFPIRVDTPPHRTTVRFPKYHAKVTYTSTQILQAFNGYLLSLFPINLHALVQRIKPKLTCPHALEVIKAARNLQ